MYNEIKINRIDKEIEMFKQYYFKWTDNETHTEEYDMSGQDYINLLDTCFKYSQFFFFHYNKFEIIIPEWLNDYTVPVSNIPAVQNYQYCYALNSMCIILNEKTIEWIRNVTDSMLSWVCTRNCKNPEDPVFLRDDLSLFFWSESHEGFFRIYVKDGEDINDILKTGLWVDDPEKLPWCDYF